MQNLKPLRKQANLTLQQLADDLGISVQVLSRYEREERQADYSTLEKIASFFNVSIDYLLNFQCDKNASPPPARLPLDENNLLDNYRALSYAGKARVSAYADLLREQEQGTNKKTNVKK